MYIHTRNMFMSPLKPNWVSGFYTDDMKIKHNHAPIKAKLGKVHDRACNI